MPDIRRIGGNVEEIYKSMEGQYERNGIVLHILIRELLPDVVRVISRIDRNMEEISNDMEGEYK